MINRFRAWLRNYFGFSQAETNGFMVLLVLMVAMLLAPAVYSRLVPPYDHTADKQLLDSLMAQMEVSAPAATPTKAYPAAAPAPPGTLPTATFDPNTLTEQDWVNMGVPEKVASRIIKYQQKGGMFKVKEDVSKMYGFPEDLFRQLYPFIGLPDRQSFLAGRNMPRYPAASKPAPDARPPHVPRPKGRQPPLQLFDLNQADTTQLMRVRGVGSKRAQWIVKHRARLGGFISTQQLPEVFGLDSAVIDSLQKYTYIAPDFTPAKVYINRATADELARHPYLTYKAARAIVAYREQHGRYTSTTDLRKVKLLSEDMLLKLAPYLQF